MTRTKSLGSHRLRRCTDLFYIPSSALLVDHRHVVSLDKGGDTRPDLPWEYPVDGDRYVACRAAVRDGEARDRAVIDSSAEPGQCDARREVTVQHCLIAARIGLEERRQLTGQRALRGRVGARRRRAGRCRDRWRGKQSRFRRYYQRACGGGINRDAKRDQVTVYGGKHGDDGVI